MSFTLKKDSLFAFFGFSLFLQLFVLLSDLVELLHVFMKLWMFSECNKQLCLLAFSSVSLNSDCFGLDLFKSSIFISIGGYKKKIPDKIFCCNYTSGNCITESMEFNKFIGSLFQIFLSQEYVEIRVLLSGDVYLVALRGWLLSSLHCLSSL